MNAAPETSFLRASAGVTKSSNDMSIEESLSWGSRSMPARAPLPRLFILSHIWHDAHHQQGNRNQGSEWVLHQCCFPLSTPACISSSNGPMQRQHAGALMRIHTLLTGILWRPATWQT